MCELADSLIGQECEKKLLMKTLDDRIKETKGNHLTETVVCVAEDKRGKITGVGFNIENDLILDNFGYWLEQVFTPVQSTSRLTSTADTKTYTGATCALQAWTTTYTSCPILGTYIRIGEGVTFPVRSDYDLNTPFTSGSLASFVATSEGSYTSGKISFMASFAADVSGDCREAGVYGYWGWGSYIAMIFHDLIVPTVPFTIGQAVHVVYGVSFV